MYVSLVAALFLCDFFLRRRISECLFKVRSWGVLISSRVWSAIRLFCLFLSSSLFASTSPFLPSFLFFLSFFSFLFWVSLLLFFFRFFFDVRSVVLDYVNQYEFSYMFMQHHRHTLMLQCPSTWSAFAFHATVNNVKICNNCPVHAICNFMLL